MMISLANMPTNPATKKITPDPEEYNFLMQEVLELRATKASLSRQLDHEREEKQYMRKEISWMTTAILASDRENKIMTREISRMTDLVLDSQREVRDLQKQDAEVFACIANQNEMIAGLMENKQISQEILDESRENRADYSDMCDKVEALKYEIQRHIEAEKDLEADKSYFTNLVREREDELRTIRYGSDAACGCRHGTGCGTAKGWMAPQIREFWTNAPKWDDDDNSDDNSDDGNNSGNDLDTVDDGSSW